ncbi:hypothetical protein DFS33DRAFT_1072210 [Desarmillaria ectypa]|nr:hypothetical protein DFS33DRAFT_1072210 [Desarmillaria ectypa]
MGYFRSPTLLILYFCSPILMSGLFTQGDGDEDRSICSTNDNFWHVFLCVNGILGSAIATFLILNCTIPLSAFCILLYKRAINDYAKVSKRILSSSTFTVTFAFSILYDASAFVGAPTFT